MARQRLSPSTGGINGRRQDGAKQEVVQEQYPNAIRHGDRLYCILTAKSLQKPFVCGTRPQNGKKHGKSTTAETGEAVLHLLPRSASGGPCYLKILIHLPFQWNSISTATTPFSHLQNRASITAAMTTLRRLDDPEAIRKAVESPTKSRSQPGLHYWRTSFSSSTKENTPPSKYSIMKDLSQVESPPISRFGQRALHQSL